MEQKANQELINIFNKVMPFIHEMDDAMQAEFSSYLETVILPSGNILFHQGDLGDSMYVITRGCLVVIITGPDGKEQRIDVLDPGASVGEVALFTGQPRSAMVKGIVDTELIRLSKAGYDRFSEKYPMMIKQLADQMLPRIQRTQLALAFHDLVGPIEAQTLHELQRKVTWHHFIAGDVLIRQGEIGDTMYLVVNGRLRMETKNNGQVARNMGEIGSGECVGEYALVSNQPRSATVIALRDSDVVGISRQIYEELVSEHPGFLSAITRLMVDRFRRNALQLGVKNHSVITIAVQPLDSIVPIQAVVQSLYAELSTFGPTLHLDRQRFDNLFGKKGAALVSQDDPLNYPVTNWLNEQEHNYQCILYELESSSSAWTQRCLRQSDRILSIGMGNSSPTITEVSSPVEKDGRNIRRELVLVQDSALDYPSDTSSWLKTNHFRTFHHVRIGVKADFARLARRITNRATCVVFSGGGARGFAQAGAIHAIEELGIPIDMIGGTSIGALMGAAMAAGMRYERIVDICRNFASPKKILDYTFPITALAASRKVSNIYKNVFGDLQIENLWTPFFCVSTNLTQSQPLIHRSGSVWLAVRASTAIPGIFSPVAYEGNVLVDGGVMNMFPVDIMKEECHGGQVIGVNCSPKKNKFSGYNFNSGVSGWRILLQKILPLGKKQKVPSIFTNLMGASEVNGIYNRNQLEDMVDILIKPPVTQFDTLDFGAYSELIEIGYQHTYKRLSEENIFTI